MIENLEEGELVEEERRMDASGLNVERRRGQTVSTFSGISEAMTLARPHLEEIYNTGGTFSLRMSAFLMLADEDGNLKDMVMSFRPLRSNDLELRGGAVPVGGVGGGLVPVAVWRGAEKANEQRCE